MNKAEPRVPRGNLERRRQPKRSAGPCPPRQGCGVDRSQHVPSRDQEETGCSKPHSGVTNSIYQVSITNVGVHVGGTGCSSVPSPPFTLVHSSLPHKDRFCIDSFCLHLNRRKKNPSPIRGSTAAKLMVFPRAQAAKTHRPDQLPPQGCAMPA